MIPLLAQFYRWDKKLGWHLEGGWCRCRSCTTPHASFDKKKFIKWLDDLVTHMDPCPDGPSYGKAD